MKIIHLVEAWTGGISTYVSTLIEHQILRGYEVEIIADITSKEDMMRIRCKKHFYTAYRSPLGILKTTSELRKILNAATLDILHCHSTFPGIYARLPSRNNRYKIIYTPHGWSFLKKDSNKLKNKIYGQIEKYLSKSTTKIICMSLEEIRAATENGISLNRIKLIYTGIPNKPINIPTNETAKIRIGFFGRLDYQKGFDLLLNSAESLNENLEVHIFGDSIREKSRPVQNARFIYHGWISQENIHNAMQEMDAIIIPSRWEGFALTPLEAMRAGKLVIISNETSLSESVIHNYNGLIIEPISPQNIANTLNSLRKEQCTELSRNARLVYEAAYCIKSFMDATDEIYKSKDVHTSCI